MDDRPRPLAVGDLWSRRRRAGSGLVAIAFGGVFLGFMIPALRANWNARAWTPTPCTILHSRVATQESSDDESTLFRAEIRYAYVVGTTRYESARRRFGDPFTNDRRGAIAAVERYAAGSAATCFVDPADPAAAVLDRTLSPVWLAGLLPAAFVVLGLSSLVSAAVHPAGAPRHGSDDSPRHGRSPGPPPADTHIRWSSRRI